jgi:hypothetical protein
MPSPNQLEQVQSLSREITAAISAIERNDLEGFRSAIANQESICNQLALTKQAPVVSNRTEQGEMRQAYLDLAQLNRVYAGVIKRSKRCADLLLALYGGCNTGYEAGAAGQIDREGLACEA